MPSLFAAAGVRFGGGGENGSAAWPYLSWSVLDEGRLVFGEVSRLEGVWKGKSLFRFLGMCISSLTERRDALEVTDLRPRVFTSEPGGEDGSSDMDCLEDLGLEISAVPVGKPDIDRRGVAAEELDFLDGPRAFSVEEEEEVGGLPVLGREDCVVKLP